MRLSSSSVSKECNPAWCGPSFELQRELSTLLNGFNQAGIIVGLEL